MYKIVHGKTPEYLLDALPAATAQPYNLRNSDAVPGIRARTSAYQNSFYPRTVMEWNNLDRNIRQRKWLDVYFYPRTVMEWNNLDRNIRQATSAESFKLKVNKDTKSKPPDWFYIGDRRWAVNHARLRMMCSSLNDHLYSQLHVVDDPKCNCGNSRETTKHFLLDCPLYHNERAIMLADLAGFGFMPTLHNLLYGSNEYDLTTNCRAFEIIQIYLRDSGRF